MRTQQGTDFVSLLYVKQILMKKQITIDTQFLLGCLWQSSRKMGRFRFFFLVFFSVSVKVLPVTPLLSGVFVHRVFFAYFVRFEAAGVMRSLLCTINL